MWLLDVPAQIPNSRCTRSGVVQVLWLSVWVGDGPYGNGGCEATVIRHDVKLTFRYTKSS